MELNGSFPLEGLFVLENLLNRLVKVLDSLGVETLKAT